MATTSEVNEKLNTPLRTPLYNDHLLLKAKMVEFAGWEMPIQYSQLKEEHLNVRGHVGLFDVSHMGEIRIKGKMSLEFLQYLTTNDVSKLNNGDAQYSLLPNDHGGLVDDIIVYCLEKNNDYLLCVNASNKDKDYTWIKKHNKDCQVIDESHLWGQIAVQGPKSFSLLKDIFDIDFLKLGSFKFLRLMYSSMELIIATTGYTGEIGVEIFVPTELTSKLWNDLLTHGKKYFTLPIGLGARDTLRMEMKYSLYGHEIDDDTNPYEAELGWVIKPDAKDFISKNQILEKKQKGLSSKLVGFKMLEKGIPRQGYELFSLAGISIGKVTSGTHSPSLDEPIGIGYVDVSQATTGNEILVDIRGRKVKAHIVKTPFVTKK